MPATAAGERTTTMHITTTSAPTPRRTHAPPHPKSRPVAGFPGTHARWYRAITGGAPVVRVTGVREGDYTIGEIEAGEIRGDRWSTAVYRAITGR